MSLFEDGNADEVYENWWKELVETDGVLDLKKVKAELFDYYTFMDEVSTAYCDITEGKFSKPNTLAVHIIDAVNERIREAVKEELSAARAHIAELEGQLCGVSGNVHPEHENYVDVITVDGTPYKAWYSQRCQQWLSKLGKPLLVEVWREKIPFLPPAPKQGTPPILNDGDGGKES